MSDKLSKAWEMMPIDWLLDGEPYVRYRTLADLLDKHEDDQEVLNARSSIIKHEPLKRIMDRQNADGYWGNPTDIHTWWPKKDTTFWLLGVLADFGFRRGDCRIDTACEYVLATQLPGGGFGWSPPPTPSDCFTGILTESLAKLGYGSDARLDKAYDWLIRRQRLDSGFWCKNSGLPGGPREGEPSCAFATLCVLGALAENANLRNSRVSKRSMEFLLRCWENRGKIKYAGHDSQIGTGWEKLKFPYTDYRILKYLDILSRFKSATTDTRMHEMVGLLISKRDGQGRYSAESVHRVWSAFDFGQKKTPSRWITFLVYHILKRFRA